MNYLLLEATGIGIEIPWWAWVLLILFLGFIFGDLTRWEYEADFDADGLSGEIEIKEKKKAGRVLEIDLRLTSRFVGQTVSIAVNDKELHCFETEESKAIIRLRKLYEGEKPEGGERVTISVDSVLVAEAILRKD